MDWTHVRERFAFLARAFEGSEGFAPRVVWVNKTADDGTLIEEPVLSGPSELTRYPRESSAKFAARNAVACYENHLLSACVRYVGFLGRRPPQRKGIDAPLVKLMVENCDLRGTSLDGFVRLFALAAKARGSMLVVLDAPDKKPDSAAEQLVTRAVPYVRAAKPESVVSFSIDEESGLFESITLADVMVIDGESRPIERDYFVNGWAIREKGSEAPIKQGEHQFGQCQVLAFTESGEQFPVIGEFSQVASLSKRLFNASSELDEILRSQTFSLLTLPITPEQVAAFDAIKGKAIAAIGTHSMLTYTAGPQRPEFISPDSGPPDTYIKRIDALQKAIARVTMEDVLDPSKMGTNESGVSRKLRFEALNSNLATFAMQLQAFEKQIWTMFARATGSGADVESIYPTDFNLADVQAELDILQQMQVTGFPPAALAEKRRSVVAAEFDALDVDAKARIEQQIDEGLQADAQPPTNQPNNQPPNAGA